MVEKQQIDIKQISIRQVGAVKTILAKNGFTFENAKEDSTKDGYTTYGTFKTPSAIIVVRLSNHICSMKNWTERYKPKLIAKPKLLRRMGKNIQDPYKERCFFSIVFKAFDYSVNDSGSWKAICNEYVFNPIEVEEGGTIGKIANDAKGLNRGKPTTINGIQPQIREVNNENENLPKATDKIPQNISVDKDGNWVSTNGWGADYVSENKQYNINRNMNKKLIRLTESDLHRIVKESVNTVLTELDWKTYANAEGEALKRSIGERPLSKAKLRKKDNSPYESFNDIRYANRRFRDAKVNAFNDTHNGAKMTKRSDEGPTLDDYDYLKTGVGPYFGNGYTHYNYKDERYKPDFLYSDADKRASEDTLKDTQEYSNYLKGNYDYQSDKGWQLKR